ncbi:hypothetical protein V6Z12_A04G037100 [Gossypium hirsutum]
MSKPFTIKYVRGIPLYGPPRTGKTVVANAISYLLSNSISYHLWGLS